MAKIELPPSNKVANEGASPQGRLSETEWNKLVEAVAYLAEHGSNITDLSETEWTLLTNNERDFGLLQEGMRYFIYEDLPLPAESSMIDTATGRLTLNGYVDYGGRLRLNATYNSTDGKLKL